MNSLVQIETTDLAAGLHRLPDHIGIIPDGNRRWAVGKGLGKEEGYEPGIDPGLQLLKACQKIGIKEVTYYGFTTDNTKRPSAQTQAFIGACIKGVDILANENASLLVVGNTASPLFPKELLPFTKLTQFGTGGIKVNFLINYGWEWDLNLLKASDPSRKDIQGNIRSAGISRVNLIIRWGGRRRLSGFLPVQSIYADFYVVDDLWPDYKTEHLYQALHWYQDQDITLGG